MGYENALSTKMLATHCACCARPLRDAISVERGVGPDCAEKHGFGEAQGEPDWAAADRALRAAGIELREGWDQQAAGNALVHRIALEQRGESATHMVNALRALGFVRMADTITRRLVRIEIELVDGELMVKSPSPRKRAASAAAVSTTTPRSTCSPRQPRALCGPRCARLTLGRPPVARRGSSPSRDEPRGKQPLPLGP